MKEYRIDLTAGHVKVIANKGDVHTFQLRNPSAQAIINEAGFFDLTFVTPLGKETTLQVDKSRASEGLLSFDGTMANGTFRLRRLNPARTILTVDVEVR